MALAFETLLIPAVARSAPPTATEGARLGVIVVFTTVESTVHALRKAGALATRLSAHITLVVPQVVPFPLPLTSPPVLLDFSETPLSRDRLRKPRGDHRSLIPLPRPDGNAGDSSEPNSLVVSAAQAMVADRRRSVWRGTAARGPSK
jgi:hypothetical protein